MPFDRRLLAWYERHGRRDLPWQRDPTPYRVWISEVMLQQTQVGTVMPYYQRFVSRFPDARTLAAAPLDAVLHLWSGLGYYSRARNLHLAAMQVCERHGGVFPDRIEAVEALPGIGRSTAAAILALATGQRHPILDGNVRRVLARHRLVEGWPGRPAVERRLWSHAEALTPTRRVAEYTQAIMDLGALVCVRREPLCGQCPVSADCLARRQGRQGELPEPRPRRPLPQRGTVMVMACAGAGAVLLERRPPAGIWGGLWSFPELAGVAQCTGWCRATLGVEPGDVSVLPGFAHTFTHFRLAITPVRVLVDCPVDRELEGGRYLWYNDASSPLGLAAPVARLIRGLEETPVSSGLPAT